jgi:membrane fusion protein (multidrug efflux system)
MFNKTLLLLSTLSIFSCKSNNTTQEPTNKQQAVFVDVMIAKPQNLENNIEVTGNVVAQETVDIQPETAGRLIYLNVPDGAFVNEGTILAKINDAELQAQLQKNIQQLELATKTEERLKKLLAIGGVNQADYDLALNNVNNLKADIALVKAQIDKTIVKAPFSGTLGLRQISIGAYVNNQTVIATLQQVNKVKIDFTVPELYVNTINKGNKIKIVADGITDYATITAIQPNINTTSRNILARAVPNKTLNPGSFVKVYLTNTNNNNNIVIPTNAIIPDAAAKKVIVVKEGKGKFVTVETGLRTETGVEVIKGLNPGDSVVVTGVLFVRPNADVKIRTVKN